MSVQGPHGGGTSGLAYTGSSFMILGGTFSAFQIGLFAVLIIVVGVLLAVAAGLNARGILPSGIVPRFPKRKHGGR